MLTNFLRSMQFEVLLENRQQATIEQHWKIRKIYIFQNHLQFPHLIFKTKQDGPSLESSSYVCDFEITWSMGPLDLGTLGLLDLFPPQQPPHTFSYLLLILTPPVSSSLVWFSLVWYGRALSKASWEQVQL